MIYRRDFDTLVTFLKRLATESWLVPDDIAALRDATNYFEQLYYGMTTSKYIERYSAAVRRLAAVRKSYRSLQAAYEKRTREWINEREIRRYREEDRSQLQGLLTKERLRADGLAKEVSWLRAQLANITTEFTAS